MFKILVTTVIFGIWGLCCGDNTINIINRCSEPIWMSGRPNFGFTNVRVPNGVVQPNGRTQAQVDSQWSGILWGKTMCSPTGTGCDSDEPSDNGPVTQAEFTFNGWNNYDSYDVSNIVGANLPMSIKPTGALNPPPNSGNTCGTAICKPDLRTRCPAQLQYRPRGRVAGCKNDHGEDARKLYLGQCPEAYAFDKDDRNTFSCRAQNPGSAQYEIIFCP